MQLAQAYPQLLVCGIYRQWHKHVHEHDYCARVTAADNFNFNLCSVEGVDFRVNQTQCSPIRTANGICNVFVDILDDGIQDSGEMFTLTLQGITDTQNTFLSTGSYTIPTLEVIIEEKPPESTGINYNLCEKS